MSNPIYENPTQLENNNNESGSSIRSGFTMSITCIICRQRFLTQQKHKCNTKEDSDKIIRIR